MQTDSQSAGYQQANRRSAQLALWTLAWVATLALAKLGPTYLWDARTVASWAAVALNVAVGIGWIVAHGRYLRGIDELQRKIVQDALAITVGVGWVVGFVYVVAEAAGLISRELEIGVFPTLLGVIYITATVVGHLRYR